MGFSSTLLFYLTAGVGVAVAIWLADQSASIVQRCGKFAAAVLFWPMFLPLLLGGNNGAATTESDEVTTPQQSAPEDEMTQAVRQVESELEAALASLDDWSEGVLSREVGRIEELRLAWRAQAERIRELDQLLDSPGFKEESNATDDAVHDDANWIQSTRTTRQENIVRLRELRSQLQTDLMATLAWVRELVTMIHLARFSGAPASRAEELVAQIAAAVEGLSEVNSWAESDEPTESSLISAS
ncbi:MAG: hypothetical protein ACKVII_03620 [Planctomycetales bacterium]|jgi:hypothetical protein